MLNSFLKPDRRYARRMARIARWDRPIETRLGRTVAWANMLLVDHGVFRLAYLNRFRVAPDLWRSAQPTPGQIARFAREGIRTIVNLRGGREHGSWALEKEACDRHGVALVDFVMRSREAPERETLLGLKHLLASVETPMLVHCKSGADRAGFFAALYVLVAQEGRVAEARRQLSLRYGHFRFAKTGILDAFLDAYEQDGERRGLPFLTWVEHHYRPQDLARSFKPRAWSTLLADGIMRRE